MASFPRRSVSPGQLVKTSRIAEAELWARRGGGGIGGGAGGLGGGGGGGDAFMPIAGGQFVGAYGLHFVGSPITAGRADISGDTGANALVITPDGESTLNFIDGGNRMWQPLYVQGVRTINYLVRHAEFQRDDAGEIVRDDDGRAVMTGNIRSLTGADFFIQDGEMTHFVFSNTTGMWEQVTPTRSQVAATQIATALKRQNVGNQTIILKAIEPGFIGHRLFLTGDIGIALDYTPDAESKIIEFYIAIQQDDTGDHEIISTDPRIQATTAVINSNLSKSPHAVTIFRLTSSGGANWFIERVGIGSVGGSAAEAINFMDLEGTLANGQVPNGELDIVKIRSYLTTSNHVILGGISNPTRPELNTSPRWGTLNDIFGVLDPNKIRHRGSTDNNRVLQVEGGEAVWDLISTSNLADFENASYGIGNVMKRKRVGGVLLWGGGKVTNAEIDNRTIAAAKIDTSGAELGEILVARRTADGLHLNFSGLEATRGNINIARVITTTNRAGELVTVDDNGRLSTTSGRNFIDVAPVNATALVAERRGGMDFWVAGKVGNAHISDASLFPSKISTIGAGVGQILIARRVGNGIRMNFGGIEATTGRLNIGRVITTTNNAGHVVTVQADGTLGAATTRNFVDVPPVNGRVIGAAGNRWLSTRVTNDYISDNTISPLKVSTFGFDQGEIMLARNVTGGRRFVPGTLGQISGTLHLNKIRGFTGRGGQLLGVDNAGNITYNARGSGGGGGASNLGDLGDVNTGSARNSFYLRYNGSSWLAAPVNTSDLSGRLSLSSPLLPTQIAAALSGYRGSLGTVESRFDRLRISDLADVNTSSRVIPGTFLKGGSGAWIASRITVNDIGDFVRGRLPLDHLDSIVEAAFLGYDNGRGTIENRLRALERR